MSKAHKYSIEDKLQLRVRVDAYTSEDGIEFPELNVGDKCEVMGYSVDNVVWVMFEGNPQFRLIHTDHLEFCEE